MLESQTSVAQTTDTYDFKCRVLPAIVILEQPKKKNNCLFSENTAGNGVVRLDFVLDKVNKRETSERYRRAVSGHKREASGDKPGRLGARNEMKSVWITLLGIGKAVQKGHEDCQSMGPQKPPKGSETGRSFRSRERPKPKHPIWETAWESDGIG